MNENPYASPEPVAEDERGGDREEFQRLRALHGGLGWVLASGGVGVVVMFLVPQLLTPVFLRHRTVAVLVYLGIFAAVAALNGIGMYACTRCPRRIVPDAGRLVAACLLMLLPGCAGLMAGKGSTVWWLGWLLLAAGFLPWQLFLLRLARGLNRLDCRVLAAVLMALWVAGWVSVPLLGTMTGLIVCLVGYGLFYMHLLWYLRTAIFEEMEKWMKTRPRRMKPEGERDE